MIIVLNGPLGIGKSTLAEALAESIDQCVMLDGDHLAAANPPPPDEIAHLHSTIALLVAHHRSFGYRHFVIDHVWRTPAELADLRRRLLDIEADADIRCFCSRFRSKRTFVESSVAGLHALSMKRSSSVELSWKNGRSCSKAPLISWVKPSMSQRRRRIS